jgi:hypothetical protein
MTQVVECLLRKCEALSSNSSNTHTHKRISEELGKFTFEGKFSFTLESMLTHSITLHSLLHVADTLSLSQKLDYYLPPGIFRDSNL